MEGAFRFERVVCRDIGLGNGGWTVRRFGGPSPPCFAEADSTILLCNVPAARPEGYDQRPRVVPSEGVNPPEYIASVSRFSS